MTPLRKRMVEDMKIRHMAPETQYRYIRAVEKFALHFGRSPEHLGQDEIREFLLCLQETGASYGVIHNYVTALRFLYRKTLRRPWTPEDIPFPREPKHLPSIPTREEILRFLSRIANIKHRAVLTTCYAAGLRVNEAVSLKVTDIDSKRMLIHVREGKRKKDRMVPLSKKLLELYRTYYRAVRPQDWLFPGRYGNHLSRRVAQTVCRKVSSLVSLADRWGPFFAQSLGCRAVRLFPAPRELESRLGARRATGHSRRLSRNLLQSVRARRLGTTRRWL